MKKAPEQTWIDIHSIEDLKQLSGPYDALVLFIDDHCSLDLTDQQFTIYANTVKFTGPIVASDKLLSAITIRPSIFHIHTAGGRRTVIFESLRLTIMKDLDDTTSSIIFSELKFNNCAIAFKWRNGLNIGADNIIRFCDCRFDNDGYLNCRYDNTQISIIGGTAIVKKKLVHIDEDVVNIKITMKDLHVTFKELENVSNHCISLDAVTMNTSCSNCDINMCNVRYHKPAGAAKLLANIINYYGDEVNEVDVDIRTMLNTIGPYPNLQQYVAYLSFYVLTDKAQYELIRELNVTCKVALEQLDNN